MASTLELFTGGTAGNADGQQVDHYTGSAITYAISGSMDAGDPATPVLVFMRTADATTITDSDITVTPYGTNAAKIQLAPDNGSGSPGTYEAAGDPLVLTMPNITNVNIYAGAFHAKLLSDVAETPQNDYALGVRVTGHEAPV